MRKILFKQRMSKLGSLVSLVGVAAMIALFSLALPGFLASASGRLFAIAWAVIAIVVFIAHINRVSNAQRRNLVPYLAGHKKDMRAVRQERRYMRS